MAKLSLFMNVTIDGYFEGPNHDISFFGHDEETGAIATERGEGGALLFGRRTYDMMASFWPTPAGEAMSPSTARIMNRAKKYVVTSRPDVAPWENVEVIGGDAMEGLRAIKKKSRRRITLLGSGTLATGLLEAGLLDEIELMVNPIALGEGTSLFEGLKRPTRFHPTDTRRFGNGITFTTYRVEKKRN